MKEFSNGPTVATSRVRSRTESCTDLDATSGRMAVATKVNINSTKSTVLVLTPTQMEASTKATGKMACSTAKDASSTLSQFKRDPASGSVAKLSSGSRWR